MVTLANTLARMDHQIDVVCLGSSGAMVDELAPEVGYHQLGAPTALRSIAKLRSILGELQPTAVISVLQGSYTSLMATAGQSNRPALIAGHHNRPREVRSIENNSPRYRAVMAVLAAAYRGVDTTVVVCEDSRIELVEMLRMDPERFEVLPNPVDLEEISRLAATGDPHPLLTEGHPSLVLVASHTPKKRIGLAIEAMEHLPEHRLVVLGEGPLLNQHQRQIDEAGLGDRVVLAGQWQNPFPSMLAADAVLSTSISEALPLGLIEAVSLGAKVVATDSGSGTRDILSNYDGGVLVSGHQASEIAASVLGVANRQVDPAQVEAKRSTYNPVSVANQYLELVEQYS